MTTLKESAENYEPAKSLTVADLEAVSLKAEVLETTKKDKEDKDYTYSYIVVDGEEYRVPASVLKQMKTIMEEKPDLKTIKVKKEGEGKGTEYTVIQLE